MSKTYTLYEQTIDNLGEPQVRALASQVGIEAWNTADVASLRAVLRSNEDARNIFLGVGYEV